MKWCWAQDKSANHKKWPYPNSNNKDEKKKILLFLFEGSRSVFFHEFVDINPYFFMDTINRLVCMSLIHQHGRWKNELVYYKFFKRMSSFKIYDQSEWEARNQKRKLYHFRCRVFFPFTFIHYIKSDPLNTIMYIHKNMTISALFVFRELTQHQQ